MAHKVSNPLKWFGGKQHIATWIIGHIPSHTLYREPYFGGGAVLFAKPCEGVSEAVNDINVELTNFWNVLSHTETQADFIRAVVGPLSEVRWKQALEQSKNDPPRLRSPVDVAADFFIRYRQGRQGLGKDFVTPTCRLRRGMNENVSAWLSAVEGLPEAHARLKRVEIRNMDACDFIRKYDHADALHYTDPPYLHSTRGGGHANKDYEHEMLYDDHEDLLNCLGSIDGKFLLSGYRSELYDRYADANGWRRVEKQIANSASSKKVKEKKTECLWMNF